MSAYFPKSEPRISYVDLHEICPYTRKFYTTISRPSPPKKKTLPHRVSHEPRPFPPVVRRWKAINPVVREEDRARVETGWPREKAPN